jgi:FkbM family methyltransferase
VDVSQPLTLGERLKYALVPARVHIWRMVRRHVRRGERELLLLPDLVTRDRVAVDIGANKGVYTHVLSRLCAHVVAFEPNPRMFAILDRLRAANVTAHQVALSDAEGEADLTFPDVPGKPGRASFQRGTLSRGDARSGQAGGKSGGQRGAPAVPHGRSNAVRVQTKRLDSYNLRNVGLIKIDVEGAEQAVLDGARDTIARERPVLVIEMTDALARQPLEASIAAVEGRGYDVFFVRDGVLQPIGDLDPVANRAAAGTPQFVFNFIARPVPGQR